jgi:hypothetical protein
LNIRCLVYCQPLQTKNFGFLQRLSLLDTLHGTHNLLTIRKPFAHNSESIADDVSFGVY